MVNTPIVLFSVSGSLSILVLCVPPSASGGSGRPVVFSLCSGMFFQSGTDLGNEEYWHPSRVKVPEVPELCWAWPSGSHGRSKPRHHHLSAVSELCLYSFMTSIFVPQSSLCYREVSFAQFSKNAALENQMQCPGNGTKVLPETHSG